MVVPSGALESTPLQSTPQSTPPNPHGATISEHLYTGGTSDSHPTNSDATSGARWPHKPARRPLPSAARGSGLDKAARLELANEALAVIAAAHPYLQKMSLEIQTELVPRHNALCTIGAAINANGGLAVPIAMSTPKDSRIEGGCGNSHLVNAPPEWAYGVDGLVDHYMRKPPVRVALAQGFVATAAPPAQQMAAPAALADVSTV